MREFQLIRTQRGENKMVKALGAPRSRRGGHAPLRWVAVALLAAAPAVFAQATAPAAVPMATPAPAPVFPIKGFKVTGDNPLGDGETSNVLAPFLRTDATLETLQKATSALEAALRDRGYGLHRVVLPPQEVGDTVSLNVIRFTVAAVHIQGASIYDEANIRRSLPELREGHSPNFKQLSIQTAITNENPNKQVQVGLRESESTDKIDATITVKEQRPWTFGVGLTNEGTRETGRDRLTFSGGHTNLFNLDHQFVGAYTTSLERPQDVQQLGLSYRAPLYSQGGVIGATYTRSDVVGNFGTFSSTGAGHTFGVNYTLYLPPAGGRRSYVLFGLDDKVFNASDISGELIGIDRRSRPVTFGYSARVESDTSVWGYNLDLSANTGNGSNNTLSAYRSEDPRITTKMWKAVRGGASFTAPLAQTWLWTARALFQYSPEALISGEQFGLGGRSSIRGASVDRPITGDMGLSGTFEVSTPELVPGLRLSGFVDAGWLGNNNANETTKPSNDRLAGVGLGLHYAKAPYALSMDYGKLITGSKISPIVNPAAPQKGEDKLYVNLSVRF
jgi:hemolysin activation/secretion protein